MKMQRMTNTGGGVPYARKESYEWEGKRFDADIQNMDKVIILDAGEIEEGQFGKQTVFKIKTRNGDKKIAFNQSSINVLVDSYGDDSEAWVNQEAVVLTKKGVYAGKKGIAVYFVTEGWYLDEFGEITRDERHPDKAAVFIPRTPNQQAVEDLRNAPVPDSPF